MSTTTAPADLKLDAALPLADRSGRWTILLHCVFFAALAYCAHFWYSGQFGVYEDDLDVFPGAAVWSWADVWHWIVARTLTLEHGRPVSFATWVLLPRLGFLVGNLHAVYVVCSLVVAANAVLFYLLLRRCYGQSIALFGALTFVLFPADTTRAFLVHTNILQPAVLFFLIGAHCYLSGRYVLTYVMGFAILLSYESPFLPFLFLPLLRPTRVDRATVRRLVVHGGLCAALMATAVAVRLAVGESRMVEASSAAHSVAYRVLTNFYLGPSTALKLFVTRAAGTVVQFGNARVRTPAAVAFVTIVSVVLLAFRHPQTGRRGFRPLIHPLLVGLAMFLTAYAFAISPEHYPPTAQFGRMTSVHLAATIGASLLFATLCQFAIQLAGRVHLRVPAALLISGYFAVLVGFAFVVQHGFVVAHDAQRNYWTKVVRLCPDLEDGTTVLLEGRFPNASWYALNTSWTDSLVLANLYQFPPTWKHPPALFRLPADGSWRDALRPAADGSLVWAKPLFGSGPPHAGDPLCDGKVILLRASRDQSIERVETTLSVQGHTLHCTAAPAFHHPYPPGPLYPLFVKDPHGPAGPILKSVPNPLPPRS